MKRIVFLDTETTGLEGSRLVQLAIKGRGVEVNGLYKPPVEIGIQAMAVHHITEKMVADRDPFELHGRAAVQAIVDDSIVVAHNAAFDIGVMKREGVEIPTWVCSKKVARHLFPTIESHSLQFLRYWMAEEVEATAHDAMGDVLVLERVFERMVSFALENEMSKAEREEFGNRAREVIIGRFIDWSSKPVLLHFVTFGKHQGKTWAEVAKTDRDYLAWFARQTDVDEDVAFTVAHYTKKP